MAGRIRDEDIALVRERTSIAEVVSERVTLKSGGSHTLKGLCPFHDEKTPSFTVRVDKGVYFCFGCGKGGDAISFVMDADHLTFVEAVEHLAGRAGIQLRYVESGPAPVRAQQGQRQRLVAAHAAAVEFTPNSSSPRRPDPPASSWPSAASTGTRRPGTGAASPRTAGTHSPGTCASVVSPTGELITAGLARPARSGSTIDRFRRRLLWPIRDITGEVIGFGARKLFDEEDGPKYLNTPETPIYKKSHVLYGIDQAKREIAKQGRVVIVEGYTDVMACHLAGVPTAVATCGTAFGADHIAVLRRLLLDTDAFTGEIIFTFDGDEAGQKAALRAFEEDQRFLGRTFIAISPDNMDPCDLRLAKGDAAVRDLVARREPLVDFALRQVLSRYDLDTVDGRVEAMRRAAPIVAKLKDREKRPEYARKLAGDLGMEVEQVSRAVAAAVRGGPGQRRPPPQVHRQPGHGGRAGGAQAGATGAGVGRAALRRGGRGGLPSPGAPGGPGRDRRGGRRLGRRLRAGVGGAGPVSLPRSRRQRPGQRAGGRAATAGPGAGPALRRRDSGPAGVGHRRRAGGGAEVEGAAGQPGQRQGDLPRARR